MRFKAPGGELTFFSICWMIFALMGMFLFFYEDSLRAKILGPSAFLVGLCTIGLWLEQRWCARLMVLLLLISIVFGVFVIAKKGITTQHGIKILTMGYNVYLLINWLRTPTEEEKELV